LPSSSGQTELYAAVSKSRDAFDEDPHIPTYESIDQDETDSTITDPVYSKVAII
jgi:hypothetical protein